MKMQRLLALQASAGSGKTFSLSSRFIALILEQTNNTYRDISSILAITFTNKACAEMKNEIIDTFLNLHNNEKLPTIASMLGISIQDTIKARDERFNEFLNANLKIYTFDAFFGQILRQFSLNAGLMPNFQTQTSSFLKNEVNKNFISSLNQNELENIAYYLQNTDFSLNQLLDEFEKFDENIFSKEFKNFTFPNKQQIYKNFDEIKKIVLSIEQKYQSKFDINKIEDIAKFILETTGSKGAIEKIIHKHCIIQKQALIESLKKFYKEFEEFKISYFLVLIQKYKNTKNGFIKRYNMLDFGDVSKEVVKLMKSIDANFLYFRLDSKIRDILIDEFQDTSLMQYQIILPLIDEVISGLGQNGIGSFFYVGDTKQCIYRFRNSQKEIFDELYKKYSPQIEKGVLKQNYRSAKNIIDFINNTFKEPYRAKNYEFDLQAIPENSNKGEGFIQVCSFNANAKQTQNDSFFTLLLEKVKFLLEHRVKLNDITILCWKNDDILEIKNYLQENGIKVASKGKKLINTKEVRLVIEQLKNCFFHSNFYDEFFKQNLHLQIPPLKLEIMESEAILKYIAKSFKSNQINPYCKNLLKLYEIAANKPNIFEFLFSIEKDESPALDFQKDGLEIMTVHSSKGLGFNHVIVCDNISGKNTSKRPFLHEYNWEKSCFDIKLNNKILDFLDDEEYKNLLQKKQKLDSDEELNKIYVAFTRAKYSLIILAAQNANGNKPSYFMPYTSNKQYIQTPVVLEEFCKGEISVKTEILEQKQEILQLDEFEHVQKQDIKSNQNNEMSNNFKAIYFGQALHYMFEMSYDFSQSAFLIAFNACKNRYGWALDDESFEDIKQRALNFYKYFNENFSHFKTNLKEFELNFNKKILRLDLLLLNKNEAVIIDYKSSLNTALNSQEQMQEYKLAVAQIFKLPVSAYFINPKKDEIQVVKI